MTSVLLATGLVVSASAAGSLPTPPSPHGSSSNQASRRVGEAFGFQVGEERRYTLGPDEVLTPGELVLWIMRLESLEGDPEDFRATFILESESERYARNNNFLNPDERSENHTRIELVVNQHGFPLNLRLERNREGSNVRQSREDVEITYEEDRFVVKNDMAMGMREFNIRVYESDFADPSVPRGVFLAPAVNPGLLTIIYRALYEPGLEKMEYWELSPTRYAGRRRASYASSPRARRLGREEYRVGDFLTIDVGTVRRDAIELKDPRVDGHSYVQPDGTVLKIDTRVRERDAWARMLFPWEY
jgi:hypothetical protein